MSIKKCHHFFARFLILVSMSAGAFAVEPQVATGQVGLFKYYGIFGAPESHIRKSVMFTLNDVSLVEPCTALHIGADDERGISVALAAKASAAEVQVEYYYQYKEQWDSEVMCLIRTITLM